jgi:Mg/Co/Ni transporter MgtE
MLSREGSIELSEITDLNQLKSELNTLPAVDVGDYISELPKERRAIAFRLLYKDRAINVFEYLPTEIQEELIEALHDTQVCQIIEAMRPDDRVALFDELPAGVVKRLLTQPRRTCRYRYDYRLPRWDGGTGDDDRIRATAARFDRRRSFGKDETKRSR